MRSMTGEQNVSCQRSLTSTVALQGPAPKYWAWYDGTNLHVGPMSIGITQTFFQFNNSGTTLSSSFQDITPAVDVTTAAGENLIIDVASVLNVTVSTQVGGFEFQILVDGSPVIIDQVTNYARTGGSLNSYARSWLVSVAAGTHVVQFQASIVGGGGAANANDNTLRVLRSAV